MSVPRVAGLSIILWSILVMMKIEGLSILNFFDCLSAWGLIFGITIGGTLMSSNPGECALCWRAVQSAFTDGVKYTQDELRIYSRLFYLMSRYSFAAGWFGLLVGIVQILGGVEEFIEQEKSIRILAAGLGLAFLCPVYGVFLSKFVFDPLKNYFEWKREFPEEVAMTVEQQPLRSESVFRISDDFDRLHRIRFDNHDHSRFMEGCNNAK